MKKGGNSAADYGQFIWGTQQQSVPGTGNLIQASGDPTKFKGGKLKGGKQSKKNRSGGEGILTATAVPALLITANHLYKRRSNKSKKYGGTDAGEQLTIDLLKQQSGQLKTYTNLTNKMIPTVAPAQVNTNTTETQTGGKGVIETVALPAVLVTANHLYRPRKTQKRNKNVRFSMKKR